HADDYRCEVHRWEPIPDAEPAPSLDWLRRMVEFVDEQQKAGRPTYVHCFAGVSRSGMVVTAYLMFKYHWTRDQALEYVRASWPGSTSAASTGRGAADAATAGRPGGICPGARSGALVHVREPLLLAGHPDPPGPGAPGGHRRPVPLRPPSRLSGDDGRRRLQW